MSKHELNRNVNIYVQKKSSSTDVLNWVHLYSTPANPVTVAQVPEEPAELRYSFLITSGNITAHLQWEPPLSDAPVQSYRVTWGEVLTSSAVWDKNTVLIKVLPKVI